MPKSSASRLLQAMREEGLLRRRRTPPLQGRQSPVRKLAQLYRLQLVADRGSPTRRCTPSAVKPGTPATCRSSTAPTCWSSGCTSGSHALRVLTPLGQRAPAFATAVGRALLARLDNERCVRCIRNRLSPPSPNAPQSIDELLAAGADPPRRLREAIDEAIPRRRHSIAVSVSDPEHRRNDRVLHFLPGVEHRVEEKNRIARCIAAGRRSLRFGLVPSRTSARGHRARAAWMTRSGCRRILNARVSLKVA